MLEKHPQPRRLRRFATAFLLLVLFGYLALSLTQAWRAVSDLRVLAADPTALAADREPLVRAATSLADLRTTLAPLPAFAAVAAPLPLLGPYLTLADAGLTAGTEALAAVQLLLDAADAAGVAEQPLTVWLSQSAAWPQLAAAEPDLRQAAAHAALAVAALDRLPPRTALAAPVRERLATLEPLLRLLLPVAESAHLAALLAPAAPTLLPLLAAADDTPAQDDLRAALATLDAQAATLPALQQSARRTRRAWDQLPLAGLPPEAAALLPSARAAAALAVPLSDALALAAALAPTMDQLFAAAAPPTELLATALPPLQPLVTELQTGVISAHAAWSALPPDAQPELSVRVLQGLNRMARAVSLLQILPQVLGSETPQATLLLALSNDEQRPGGGFLTSAGRIVLHDGAFTLPRMEDSLTIVPPPRRSSPPAPAEMAESMRIYRWFFRDANWSPDFPESVRVARLLYAQSGRGSVTQVVALDLIALTELVDLVGPLTLSDAAQPIAAADVHAYLQRAHDRNSDDNSPAVSALLRALLAQLLQRGDRALALAYRLHDLAERRHLLIVSDDQRVAALLHSLGWDGALTPGAHDYLALIEANVGYTKTSAALHAALEYTVDLRAPFSPQAVLTLTQALDLPPRSSCPPLVDPQYGDLMAACHRALVQLLVPRGSTLLAADLPPAPITWLWDQPIPTGDGVRVRLSDNSVSLAHYYALLPGGRRRVVLRYSLPATVLEALPSGGWRYRLRLQKQVSQPALPVTVNLLLPDGFQIRDAAAATRQLQLDGTSELVFDIVAVGVGSRHPAAALLR